MRDNSTNILFGLHFINRLIDNKKNLALALAGYNAGSGDAEKAIKGFPETRKYIPRVLAVLELFEKYPA